MELAVWLLAFAVVFAWQIQAVIRSSHPGLRAAEAVAVSVPFAIVLFASAYFVIGQTNPASFTEALTRIDAMYFTVTVFATVGFGARSHPGPTPHEFRSQRRLLTDLVLIGLIAKVLFGAVQYSPKGTSVELKLCGSD